MTLGKLIHKYAGKNNTPKMKSLADFENLSTEPQQVRHISRNRIKQGARATKKRE